MSASTHTRRLSTPSRANAVTRARLTRRPSKRPLEVVQPEEPPTRVEHHTDGVEAQLRGVRALLRLAEPSAAHAPHLAALALAQRVPGRARALPPRLDLAEHD